MQVNVTGHHIDVTDALRDYVGEKLERLERHADDLIQAHVVLNVEKLQHKAEATVHVTGEDLHAEATAEDMYAAIDALADKMDRQVKKHKEKLNERQQGRAAKRTGM